MHCDSFISHTSSLTLLIGLCGGVCHYRWSCKRSKPTLQRMYVAFAGNKVLQYEPCSSTEYSGITEFRCMYGMLSTILNRNPNVDKGRGSSRNTMKRYSTRITRCYSVARGRGSEMGWYRTLTTGHRNTALRPAVLAADFFAYILSMQRLGRF